MQHISETAMVLKDGRTLGYAEYVDPKGTPIMLFHGMPGSRLAGKIFDQVAQAQQVRLLIADRPGYATSSAVHHGTLLGFVNDVSDLADALQVESFAVLGVSGGAPFALACAAKIPQRVSCCGLMSAVGPLALPHSMDGMASANRLFFTLGRFMPTVIAALVSRQLKGSIKSMQNSIDEGKSPLADVSPEVFAQLMADQFEAVRTGSQGIQFDMRIVTRPWGFELEQIHITVSMWHGAEDTLAPMALARYVAEHIPGCAFKTIPGAGHAGTFSCVDEVIKTLTTC